MEAKDVVTVGDLINFLSQVDPHKKIMIYNHEWGVDNPLQHIDVEDTVVIFYD